MFDSLPNVEKRRMWVGQEKDSTEELVLHNWLGMHKSCDFVIFGKGFQIDALQL